VSVTNGNGVWKYIAMSAIGILLGMGVQVFREPKDMITEKELNRAVAELQAKIDAQTKEIIALRSSVNQQSVDIAGIASKMGVTAHPAAVPSN
jgi:cell division protein FtsL